MGVRIDLNPVEFTALIRAIKGKDASLFALGGQNPPLCGAIFGLNKAAIAHNQIAPLHEPRVPYIDALPSLSLPLQPGGAHDAAHGPPITTPIGGPAAAGILAEAKPGRYAH